MWFATQGTEHTGSRMLTLYKLWGLRKPNRPTLSLICPGSWQPLLSTAQRITWKVMCRRKQLGNERRRAMNTISQLPPRLPKIKSGKKQKHSVLDTHSPCGSTPSPPCCRWEPLGLQENPPPRQRGAEQLGEPSRTATCFFLQQEREVTCLHASLWPQWLAEGGCPVLLLSGPGKMGTRKHRDLAPLGALWHPSTHSKVDFRRFHRHRLSHDRAKPESVISELIVAWTRIYLLLSKPAGTICLSHKPNHPTLYIELLNCLRYFNVNIYKLLKFFF